MMMMVLVNVPVPGRPIIWLIVGQGTIAPAVDAGGVVRIYLLSSIFPLPFLLLSGRQSDVN